MVSIYDVEGMERLRARHAVQPHRMKRFRNAFFKKAEEAAEALGQLPEPARAAFAEQVAFHCLELAERRDSRTDGATKLLFRTADGLAVESVVLRPRTGRTSLCVSSQAGCACGCDFCATGKMGLQRDLGAGEILDQVARAARLVAPEGRSIRNVVFMGMGEPLLNSENLFRALELLGGSAFFDYAGSRLMVSSVGIPHAMEELARRFPQVRQAISLHSARQEVRERLMPLAGKYPLGRLRQTLERLAENGKVMVEYLMLEGVNDGEEDFQALEAYLRGLPVHINIIPFNAFAGCDLRGTPRGRREAFAARLKRAGFDTTLRYSFGADISAACGQLAQADSKG